MKYVLEVNLEVGKGTSYSKVREALADAREKIDRAEHMVGVDLREKNNDCFFAHRIRIYKETPADAVTLAHVHVTETPFEDVDFAVGERVISKRNPVGRGVQEAREAHHQQKESE